MFNGSGSLDGAKVPIGGANTLSASPIHPTDNSPADWTISIREVTAYSAAWKRGSAWALPPNPIPIDYLTRAALLWQRGEAYRYDPTIATAPLCWVNASTHPDFRALGLRATGKSLSAAQRMIAYSPGSPASIAISVSPNSAVQAYAVEDRPPAGWLVSLGSISDQGTYDQDSNKVKWGPFFDAKARVLSYQASGPSTGDAIPQFNGVASFDGANVPILTLQVLKPNFLLAHQVVMDEGGRSHVHFEFTIPFPGAYSVEASEDLEHWTLFDSVASPTALTIQDPSISISPRRFYRVIPR